MLVVDPDERVLLFSSGDAAGGTWWFTPGGGVHRGETVTEAAVRELSEETGFACAEDALGPIVATSAGLWKGDYDGTLFLGAHSFFPSRSPHPVIDTDGQEEFELVVHDRAPLVDARRAAEDHGRHPAAHPC